VHGQPLSVPDRKSRGVFRINIILYKTLHLPISFWLFRLVTSTLGTLTNIFPSDPKAKQQISQAGLFFHGKAWRQVFLRAGVFDNIPVAE